MRSHPLWPELKGAAIGAVVVFPINLAVFSDSIAYAAFNAIAASVVALTLTAAIRTLHGLPVRRRR